MGTIIPNKGMEIEMSRSYKHTPIFGNTGCRSDKIYKRHENRRRRRAEKVIIHTQLDDAMFPHPKTYGNPWGGGKDGKHYWSDSAPTYGSMFGVFTIEQYDKVLIDSKLHWIKCMRK